uniref:Retrovirus-related Pol polyprotein from transposon 17.6 n=1 Tax=Tanacetum cinerariifolium TaxID=118510 RepID=A0A6L2L6Y5_TANCI|nr:retrovirus-related Pol polyprotein from transposon 17.6 [Tanacetum cinerariifolium]
MKKEDEEKTAFITSQGIFCYSKMPFGLRNVGATYQHLVDKAFHKQIGRNLEVYVDDLVIKSRMEDEIIRDIEETFKTLREINMKLNPKNLPLGVHKESNFHWTEEAESAFKQIKQLIAKLPTLTTPEEKEELVVYLSVAQEAVSAILMTEREAKQMPIYFASRSLRGPKVNYTSMEKLVLALVHSNKRLKRYFQTHPIIVVTDQPIKQVLSKPELAGRLQKWSIELEEYAIHYRPRNVLNKTSSPNALSKIASTSFAHLSKQVLVEKLKEKSINEVEVLALVEEEGNTWMTPIYKYLTEGTLPAEANKGRNQGKDRRKQQELDRRNLSCPLGTSYNDQIWQEDTLFSLTYGTKAFIPTEIGMPTLRTWKVDMVQNNEALEINLDLLEERREQVAICEAKSKAKWKNITTQRSVAQASSQKTSCIVTMMQVVWKK